MVLNLGYLATWAPLAAALAGLTQAANPAILSGFVATGAVGLWLALIHAEPMAGRWALAALLPGAGLLMAALPLPQPGQHPRSPQLHPA